MSKLKIKITTTGKGKTATMPDALREIGESFFAAAEHLELTGRRLRKEFVTEQKRIKTLIEHARRQ